MPESILNSTKKNLGLAEGYDAFDVDVITQINSAFFTLFQIGVGPSEGFQIEGDTETWDDFVLSPINKSAVKSYVYLKTRLAFDPPGTPHHLTALKEQITELEYRLKTERELTTFMPSPMVQRPPLSVQGGNLDD